MGLVFKVLFILNSCFVLFQSMSDSNMLTVSFGTWMELPNLKMTEWKPSLIDNAETRVSVATVADYYQDYVRFGLQHRRRILP